jgi:enoyl-CoA hydratase/carnithine racemase
MADATLQVTGGIVMVVFDRQDKRNAVNSAMLDVLWQGVRLLDSREDLRAMIITGEGPYFTAGIDLDGDLARRMAAPTDQFGLQFRRVYRDLHRLHDEFESIEKPIIVAVQGHCFGVGVELAASCDFRFASTDATFALPEVRIGVIAGSGGTSRLTRLIGPHWAKWLAMAGQRVEADTALRIGLVHEVVPRDQLKDRVMAFVDDLTTIPPETLGLAKLAVDMSVDVDRTNQRHIERMANTILFGTPEFLARTARFRSAERPR